MKRIPIPTNGMLSLFGANEENLRYLERLLEVRLTARGEELLVDGKQSNVRIIEKILWQLTELIESGCSLTKKDFKAASDLLIENPAYELKNFFLDNKIHISKTKSVTPRSLNQKRYIESIKMNDIVFGVGPAGTGKTYLAIAMAVASLQQKARRRVILTRPAVEAGEKLGYLPGDLFEKIDPYLRPLFDALNDMLDAELISRYISRGIIEIAPIGFMRGRTLNDCFVILDEAQNTSSLQMKMFLTRLGFNTKAVITGDITQIDLPAGQVSGLKEAHRVLSGIEGIQFVQFNDKDVVRHPLVKSIILAYERYTANGNGEDDFRAEAADPPAVTTPGEQEDFSGDADGDDPKT